MTSPPASSAQVCSAPAASATAVPSRACAEGLAVSSGPGSPDGVPVAEPVWVAWPGDTALVAGPLGAGPLAVAPLAGGEAVDPQAARTTAATARSTIAGDLTAHISPSLEPGP